jgi:hypothetical protein
LQVKDQMNATVAHTSEACVADIFRSRGPKPLLTIEMFPAQASLVWATVKTVHPWRAKGPGVPRTLFLRDNLFRCGAPPGLSLLVEAQLATSSGGRYRRLHICSCQLARVLPVLDAQEGHFNKVI